jgi:hypothetical protein
VVETKQAMISDAPSSTDQPRGYGHTGDIASYSSPDLERRRRYFEADAG